MADSADVALVATTSDPVTYDEALTREDSDLWVAAMEREVENLRRMGTFEEVKVDPSVAVLGGKWVYKVKTALDGKKETRTYKACFVAQGFRQIWGRDFDQTHAPVVRTESLRVVVAVMAAFGWLLGQLDVVGAYLNGILDEEIYMR